MTGETKKSSYRTDQKRNNKLFIFFICLLIASTLWLIKAMEKEYETTVSLTVKYTNLPRNIILVNPPPTKLEVKIKSHGFTLLRHKIGLTVIPVNLNIKPFTNSGKKTTDLPKFNILSDRFIPQIADQINQDIRVLDVSPDTLYFHYDLQTEKKVRVISRIQINCQNQYFLSDSVKITPSFITVRGPISIVDTLTGISTVDINFNNLTTSVHSIISLESIKQLEYSTEKVSIEVPVAQFTEYNEKINVNAFNIPDHLNLITFPGKVNVSCLIAFDKFNSINPGDFEIGVDFNDISTASNNLPIIVRKQPDFIKSLKIQPLQVEYIIKRK